MVQFGVLDCPVFLTRGPSVLLVADPEQVLTISGGSASVVVSMVHTTPPKEDKVGTSSAEVPMAQVLVAQLGSKAPDDTFVDDDPDLLTCGTGESEIVYRTSSRL
jgi:hypothetical protein